MALALPIDVFVGNMGGFKGNIESYRVQFFKIPRHTMLSGTEYYRKGTDKLDYQWRFDTIAIEVGFITVCFGLIGTKYIKN